MHDTIGIDISKPTLDAFRLSTGEHRQFPNDKSGCSALIRWVGKAPVRIVFEPTGPYHRLLEQTPIKAGLAMVKINPRSARRFAEATGELAKTDRIDAALLARMGAVLDLKARPARLESHHDLRKLSVTRQALNKDRIAARNREQVAQNAIIRRQLKARLCQIERQIGEIEKAMAAIVAAHETLTRRREILASIPGIGPITAMAILVEMPELGEMDGKQAAHAPRERLRLTAPLTFGTMELAPTLNTFALKYAEIELNVSFTDRVVNLVDEGFDVTVRVERPGDSNMIAGKLCDVRIVVVGSPAYLEFRGELRTPDDLFRLG